MLNKEDFTKLKNIAETQIKDCEIGLLLNGELLKTIKERLKEFPENEKKE